MMTVLPVSAREHVEDDHQPLIETPSTFSPVLAYLSAEKIDEVLTKLVYEVDWEGKKKVTINVIANVSSMHAKIIGYLPVAGVTLGAIRISAGVLKIGLAAASLGACTMLGLPQAHSFADIVSSVGSVKQGVIEIMPLAVGAGMYLSNYTPSFDVLVTDLKVSQDKMGVISNFCQQATESAMAAEKEKYAEYKPWAQTVLHVAEKTYHFATEGADCIVTCAAWGNIAVGVGALVASPYTGGSSLPYALTSIAKGAFALGASSLLELAQEYDLQGKVTRLFSSDEATEIDVDSKLFKLQLLLGDCADFGEAYEAIDEWNRTH